MKNLRSLWKVKRKRSTLLFVLAGLLALLMGFYIQKQVNEMQNRVNVLVVTQKITEFSTIEAADVGVRMLPRTAVPDDAIRDKEEVIGKYTAMGILPGAPLREGHLLSVDSWAGLLLYTGDGGKVAMPLSLETSETPFIQAGDQLFISGFIRQGTHPTWVAVSEVPVLAKQKNVILVALSPENARKVDKIRFSGGKVRVALLPKVGRGF